MRLTRLIKLEDLLYTGPGVGQEPLILYLP